MTTLHAVPVTPDPSYEDALYRAKCETEFGLRPDPAERDRYPVGYWKQCYEAWMKEETK